MTEKNKGGRPPKSGAYSLTYQDSFIGQHPELRAHLEDVRAGLVRCLGPMETDLSTQQLALVDRSLNILKRLRIIEYYLDQFGLLSRAGIERKRLEPEPILQVYISLNNSFAGILRLLGLSKRDEVTILSTADYIARIDGEAGRRGITMEAQAGPELQPVQEEAPETLEDPENPETPPGGDEEGDHGN